MKRVKKMDPSMIWTKGILMPSEARLKNFKEMFSCEIMVIKKTIKY